MKHNIKCCVVKRVCNCIGCGTILSRYNFGDKCAIHAGQMTVKEMHDYMYDVAAGQRQPTLRKSFKVPKVTCNKRYS